jgi:hypothetical protein
MFTAQWITNLVTALRTAAMVSLLAQGFAPADVLAMAGPSVVAPSYEYNYREAA